MKRLPPPTFFGRVWYLVARYRYFFIVFLLIALLSSLLYYTPQYISRVTPRFETNEYLVAKEDIAPFTKLSESQLTSVSFVEGYTPKNAISADQKQDVVDKYAATFLAAGDIITPLVLADNPSGGIAAASRIIPYGKKLYYLSPSAIPPGLAIKDHIDIVAATETSTSAILKSVMVLDIVERQETGESFLGLLLSDSQILDLTRSLAQKAYLQIVLLPHQEKYETSALVK